MGLGGEKAVVNSISCKLFKTKKELAMKQEVAEGAQNCPDSRPSWARWEARVIYSHLREVAAVWVKEVTRE